MARKIKLTQGKYAIVDDEEFDKLNKFKWYYHNGYAVRQIRIPMTNFIVVPTDNFIVDHKNGDRLDNRKENLRPVTNSQNAMNYGVPNNNTSGYRGVALDKRLWRKKNWRARIVVGGKEIFLGYWSTKQGAALARKLAEKKYFGEYIRKDIQWL